MNVCMQGWTHTHTQGQVESLHHQNFIFDILVGSRHNFNWSGRTTSYDLGQCIHLSQCGNLTTKL